LTGDSLTSNVFADLYKQRPYADGVNPDTYIMITSGKNGGTEFRVAAERFMTNDVQYTGESISYYWENKKYYYLPVNSTSSVAAGDAKKLAMAYQEAWSVVSNDTWISVSEAYAHSGTPGFTQTGFDALDVFTEPNASSQMRTGSVTVTTTDGSDTIYIHQDGTNPQISISTPFISSYANGKEDTLAVGSNVNWVAHCDAHWIELDYAIGVGNEELPFAIVENDTGETRTATITIEGGGIFAAIAVTQSADPEPTTYSITFDANGGIGAPSPQTKSHGVSLILSSIEPQRAGYVFLGWSTDFAATTATYPVGGTYAPDVPTTLYAIWVELVYLMELTIDAEWLVYYELLFDQGLNDGYCTILLSGMQNIIILPEVYRIDERGDPADASGEIEEIKYFLDCVEYDTLTVGELGEFDVSTIWGTNPTISISVTMTDGTAIICTFIIDVMIIQPR